MEQTTPGLIHDVDEDVMRFVKINLSKLEVVDKLLLKYRPTATQLRKFNDITEVTKLDRNCTSHRKYPISLNQTALKALF
jgi:hypothetical protein